MNQGRSLLVFILFFILCFAYLLFIPYGDEPDFIYHVNYFINDLGFFYSDKMVFGLCDDYGYSRGQFFNTHINAGCMTDFNIFLSRAIYILIVSFALLLFYSLLGRGVVSSNSNSAVLLSLLTPSFVYYYVSVGYFNVFLMLALVSFSLRNGFLILIPLALMAVVDGDKALVAVCFYVGFFAVRVAYNKFGFFLTMSSLVVLLLSLFFFEELFFELFSFSYKVSGVRNAILNGVMSNDYPFFVRYIYSFFSFILITAEGLKFYPAYIVFLIFFVSKFNSIRSGFNFLSFDCLVLIYIFLFHLAVVYLAPTHIYSRYYIYMLPFVYYVLLRYVSFKSVLILLLLANFFIFINLFFLWLI